MQVSKPHRFSIDALNKADNSQAAAIMDRIVERSTWLAYRAAAARPFRDVNDLANWLETEVRSLSHGEALELLCAHPELSPPNPTTMTQASQREQDRLHLVDPDKDTAKRLTDLNKRYLRRHGYPFVVALHAQHDVDDVIAQFEQRLVADPDKELNRSLGEVVSVMQARLAEVSGDITKSGPANSSPNKARQVRP
ncbi:MAG: 2-oxo-4-hydroxy-4-carboxy-5-ureidoimidazoline decarboxylase [Roseobacter sp.]